MAQTKTELHTHFVGMLTAEKFLDVIGLFTRGKIYWPIDKPIDSNTEYVNISDVKKSKEYLDMLRIEHGSSITNAELHNYYYSRSELLKYAIKEFTKGEVSYAEAEQLVYSVYLDQSLKELIKQGVKYAEISYSNPRVIKSIIHCNSTSDKIKTKFLLSTSRHKYIKDYEKSADDVAKLLDAGLAAGFDIMGNELPLTDIEKDYNSKQSFKRKLEILVDSLHKYDNSTLRIHSGETFGTDDNTEQTLTYLKELKDEKGIQIPPPEIRIGHGLHFKKSDNYINLLKEFNVTVEINASSNMELSNAKSILDIPYDYYLNNGINLVVSTDGHGLYDTTIKREDSLAQFASNNYNQILKDDREVRARKK